jgi:uncharacterized membrane protein HdeD (DUF308 family)
VTTTAATRPADTRSDTARWTRAVQVLAVLVLLNELYQFVTAGRLFPDGGPEEAHAAGAVALHVLSGLTAIAVYLRHRAAGGRLWPVVLAAVVFVATFVQAATGGREHLAIHVPGAMILTAGTAWLATWAFLRTRDA